jgi:hypothetical protein
MSSFEAGPGLYGAGGNSHVYTSLTGVIAKQLVYCFPVNFSSVECDAWKLGQFSSTTSARCASSFGTGSCRRFQVWAFPPLAGLQNSPIRGPSGGMRWPCLRPAARIAVRPGQDRFERGYHKARVANHVCRGKQSPLSNGMPSQDSWGAQGPDQNHSWSRLPPRVRLAKRKSDRRLKHYFVDWGGAESPQVSGRLCPPQITCSQGRPNCSKPGALLGSSAT